MPYGGTTPEEDEKIDRCIASISGINPRTGKPYTKEEKIAICKAQVLKGRKKNGDNMDDNDVETAEWDRAYINDLPDSAFAVIEPAYKRGETDNKNARHLPYKDKNGKVDLPHLRNALARMNQIKPVTDSISTEELRAQARKVLIPLAKKHLPDSKWAKESEKDIPAELSEIIDKVEKEGITLSMGKPTNIELVEDTEDFKLLKFELIDVGTYNGVEFDEQFITEQFEAFKKMQSDGIVIPHGLDHSKRTLDQLGQVVDMEIVGKGSNRKAVVISKIFKETLAQKQAHILFNQGNLNYISGGWTGKLIYNDENNNFKIRNGVLREVSSTPVPAKQDARLLEVLNSLGSRSHKNTNDENDTSEELDMNEKPTEQPSPEGAEEHGDEFTALKEKVELTATELAEIKARQEEQLRATLLMRGSELGLSADLFEGKSPSEIEFALEVANEAVVVALRDKEPTTGLGGAGDGAIQDGTPEAVAKLREMGYYQTLIGGE